MNSNKYNIRPEYLDFDQPSLDGSIDNLRMISQEFENLRKNFEWDADIASTTHTVSNREGYNLEIIEISPKSSKGKGETYPSIIYYHGGGFFSTYSIGQLQMIQNYSLQVDCKVFLIDYRKDIDHPCPLGFNDCFDGFIWILNNATQLNVNTNKLVLLGDSAGGCLAAGVAQKVTDLKSSKLAGLFLIYPVLEYRSKHPSATFFTDVPIWTAGNNRIMWDIYLRNITRSDPDKLPDYISPSHHKHLRNLPVTYMETAEFDAVRDEGVAFAHLLMENEVEVELNNTKGTIHAFDFVDCPFTRQVVSHRIKVLRRMLL